MPSRDPSATRLRDCRSTPQTEVPSRAQPAVKEEMKRKTFMDQWVEPTVASQPSYNDQSGAPPYGVLEHMQPLGDPPNAKVKARVRSEAPRKSVLGRSSAATGAEAQESLESTPGPPSAAAPYVNGSPQPLIVIDDENDADYAPEARNKDRTTRLRSTNRWSEPLPATSVTGTASTTTMTTPATTDMEQRKHKATVKKGRVYDARKLKEVVEAAQQRAIDAGKPDLAAAVHEIWVESLKNAHLTDLVEAILTQKASAAQTEEFQNFVKRAKQRLRDAKGKSRKKPALSANGPQSLPLRSPSKFTTPTQATHAPPSAIPSTEAPESTRPRVSITLKSPSKDMDGRRRSAQTASTRASPPRHRQGSESSDLTDLTSDGEGAMDVDEHDGLASGPPHPPPRLNGLTSKDHAAERGSLAAPDRKLKRSSAEADIEDEERDRVLAAKKLKLAQSIKRDVPFEESDLRETGERSLRAAGATNRSLGLPPLTLAPTSSRLASAGGSRGPSTELESPLSELTPNSSRMSTPRTLKAPPKPPAKRAKTKNSPEKKHLAGYGGLSGAGGAGRESPIGDDDNEELSENNDFCSACGGSGFLLCCDGCDRSFHFSCLDPPLNEDASELNEPWFCFKCVAKRPIVSESPEKPVRGIFAPLFNSLRKRNPSNFALPQEVREYYEGVQTDKSGNFIEAVQGRTKNRSGYDEQPDYVKIKDGKGNTVLCIHCQRSSQGQPQRPIIQCDYCGNNWHLDCLDPPLANPPARSLEGKKIHDWMCPAHADQELRRVDTSLLIPRRKIHVRRPRNAKVADTALTRGFQNNGVIDILDDDSDDSESEFYDEETPDEAIIYRMPASGIKLDFIDKVKSTRVQQLRNEHVHKRARLTANPSPSALQQANFSRRSFAEQQLALILAQFASQNKDLELGRDQVENLVGALIAEAPCEVVSEYTAAEDAEKIKSTAVAATVIPPSPPASEQTDQLSAEQRKELERLQELIRRRLEGSKT